MIKAVIFDWFGVCTVENWRDAVARELNKRLGLDEALVKTEFKKLTPAFAAAAISPVEFLNKLIASLGLQPPAADFNYVFQTIPALNMDVLNLARRLRSHYKVYLLSNNFGPVFPLYQKQLDLSEYFDDLFLSHEMKMNKTQDNIWELLLQRIKYRPSEILFIDNTEKYLALAKTLGVNGLLYKDYSLLLKELNELGII